MTMQEFNEAVKNQDYELLRNVKSHGIKVDTIWNRDFCTWDDLIEYEGFIYQVQPTWGILNKKET